MNIPDYLVTLVPSPSNVEKIFHALSLLAPNPATVWAVLNTLSRLAPDAASVWMLPLAAIGVAVVHALLTRRSSMMVGAALVLCFYTAGHMLLPTVEGVNEKQMVLLVTLHTWFTCVAAELFFVCIAFSLAGHGIKFLWRQRSNHRSTVTSPLAATPATKKAPVLKATKPVVAAPKAPMTLNELSAARKATPPVKAKQILDADSIP